MLPGDARAKYRWGIYKHTRIQGYRDTGIQGKTRLPEKHILSTNPICLHPGKIKLIAREI